MAEAIQKGKLILNDPRSMVTITPVVVNDDDEAISKGVPVEVSLGDLAEMLADMTDGGGGEP